MRLKELRLQTKHLSALFNFYADVLELPVVKHDNTISITAGNSKIIFEETNTANPFYHFAFNIPSNKFEDAFQWAKNKVGLLWLDDYKSYTADFVNWHARSFYFLDPAGNILEFIARFDLNDSADESFNSKHIRNVSEIGLVFSAENFNSDVNKLFAQYPLSYFEKQPPLPQFKAVGNDEGLFIIVPQNRVWFPTKNTISRIFKMEILFIENNNLHELKL
jgi:hypothetical protein